MNILLSQRIYLKNLAPIKIFIILNFYSLIIYLITMPGCSDHSAKNSKNKINSEQLGEIASCISKAKYLDEILIPDTIRISVPAQFSITAIKALNISQDKKIIIINFFSEIVLYFDSAGNFIRQIGNKGRGPGEFLFPSYCGFDEDGKIFIGDFSQRRISVFDETGEFIESFLVKNMLNGMLVLPGNRIIIHDQTLAMLMNHETVFIYDHKGNLLRKFGGISESMKKLKNIPSGASLFFGPYLATYENYLFEFDYVDYHIKKYDIEGNLIAIFGAEPKQWHSVLETNYRQIPAPQMVTPEILKKLDEFFVEFHKCTINAWITVFDPGIIVCMSLKQNRSRYDEDTYFVFYDLDGNLLNNGLTFKHDSKDDDNLVISILPILNGFCLVQNLADQSKEMLINEADVQELNVILFNFK